MPKMQKTILLPISKRLPTSEWPTAVRSKKIVHSFTFRWQRAPQKLLSFHLSVGKLYILPVCCTEIISER